jgi:hypothetical protein
LKLDESKESEAEELGDDLENKIVSIKHFNLNGKVLGMRKKGALMIVLMETLSYVIMQFNQQTQDFTIIGQFHLEQRKKKSPYRDYALL